MTLQCTTGKVIFPVKQVMVSRRDLTPFSKANLHSTEDLNPIAAWDPYGDFNASITIREKKLLMKNLGEPLILYPPTIPSMVRLLELD